MNVPGTPQFPTTSWSLVRRAGNLEVPESRAALASLCQEYWYPLYAFLRRSGRSREDAEDLVQAFFARILEAKSLEQLTPERGSFRGFLLVALKNFVATDSTRARAEKRGGARAHLPISLDLDDGHNRYQAEAASAGSPDEVYERRWALTILANVVTRLRLERERQGDASTFLALQGFLPGSLQGDSYETVALKLNMSPGAVKVAVHRLRSRYRSLLRAEIATLVNDRSEVDQERRYLHSVLSR
jgi:RNA polymerase sigma factor (sigma-70 family)